MIASDLGPEKKNKKGRNRVIARKLREFQDLYPSSAGVRLPS
jgi:hypothetical protein